MTGDAIGPRPIKGTGRDGQRILPKDHAENVMIVDLVRNDLGRVCRTGSVQRRRAVRRRAAPGAGAPRLDRARRAATGRRAGPSCRGDLPARIGHRRAQVGGAADHPGAGDAAPRSLLRGIGWVDADRGTGELAVGHPHLLAGRRPVCTCGTGAGITWGCDPDARMGRDRAQGGAAARGASGSWKGTDA